MRIIERDGFVRVDAPAKINLFLEILAQRQDGYHELETLMATVGIYDTIEFVRTEESSIELTCRLGIGLAGPVRRASVPGTPFPLGRENLVYRALDALRQATGYRGGGRVHLHKRIPWQAGLGGGSSDAAAALWAANRAWGLNWSRREMVDLASRLGSDIPFFFWGGAAVCRGRGERVSPLRRTRRLPLVIAIPPVGLATADVFRQCTVADAPQRVEPCEEAWNGSMPGPALPNLFNRLEAPACRLEPAVDRLRTAIAASGASAARMSGSGSSCFGICRSMPHARRVAGRLRAEGWTATYVTTTVEA